MEQSFADKRAPASERQLGGSLAPYQCIVEVRRLNTMHPIQFSGSIITDRVVISSYTAMTSRHPGSAIVFLFGSDIRHALTRFTSSGWHASHSERNMGMHF